MYICISRSSNHIFLINKTDFLLLLLLLYVMWVHYLYFFHIPAVFQVYILFSVCTLYVNIQMLMFFDFVK